MSVDELVKGGSQGNLTRVCREGYGSSRVRKGQIDCIDKQLFGVVERHLEVWIF